eukprot:944763-Amphidinium_carterae.1
MPCTKVFTPWHGPMSSLVCKMWKLGTLCLQAYESPRIVPSSASGLDIHETPTDTPLPLCTTCPVPAASQHDASPTLVATRIEIKIVDHPRLISNRSLFVACKTTGEHIQ